MCRVVPGFYKRYPRPVALEQQVMRPAHARDQMLEQAQTLAKGLATTAAATAATAFGSFL